MKSTHTSRILAVILAFNVFQFIMILLKPGDAISWSFVGLFAIPLFFVSYKAMKLNQVAYLLLLYWFLIQIFSFDFGSAWKLAFSYGFFFQITFLNGAFGVNPIALLLLVLALLEVDKIFPEQSESGSITVESTNESVNDYRSPQQSKEQE